jgi:hypothetical protein
MFGTVQSSYDCAGGGIDTKSQGYRPCAKLCYILNNFPTSVPRDDVGSRPSNVVPCVTNMVREGKTNTSIDQGP